MAHTLARPTPTLERETEQQQLRGKREQRRRRLAIVLRSKHFTIPREPFAVAYAIETQSSKRWPALQKRRNVPIVRVLRFLKRGKKREAEAEKSSVVKGESNRRRERKKSENKLSPLLFSFLSKIIDGRGRFDSHLPVHVSQSP